MSILSSSEAGGGSNTANFTYDSINKTANYVIKVGDLILDSLGYLYSITALQADRCEAKYTNIFLNRDGVGITNVEAKASSEPGGENVTIITLSNGNTHSFTSKNGVNGKSLYEMAKDNGFDGDEKAWIDHLGYEDWLKGKAVTQDEYDAMPDNEKYQAGFMYVIKDAKINVNTADKANTANTANTASTLSLEKVHEGNCYGGGTFTGVSLSDGVYMVHWKTDEGYISGDGLLYLDNTTFYHNCGSYVDNTNTIYACEATLTNNGHYGFRIIKHSGTITTERSYVGGTISVYKIK
jgi:hypothetical protein